MKPIITLLTDFGGQDSYVGQMKGAMLAINRRATLVDLTHAIPPQQVLSGAFELWRSWKPFPEGTVHVAVVDPGVGTSRRVLAAAIEGHIFVAPDNGLLSLVMQDAAVDHVIEATVPRYWRGEISTTFHGRDIFGPLAAHLALGVPLAEVGAEIDRTDVTMLEYHFVDGSLEQLPRHALVCHVDRFGNLILSIRGPLVAGRKVELINQDSATIATTGRCYGDGSHGELLLMIGSSGLWEVSVVGGSAAERLRVGTGDEIEIRPYE